MIKSVTKGQYMKLIIASNNAGKIKEFKEMLTPLGYEPVSMKEAGINTDIAEDGTTFSENAHIKAKTIYDMTHTPVLADDSGLSIEFLGGAPGIYSARYSVSLKALTSRSEMQNSYALYTLSVTMIMRYVLRASARALSEKSP